MRALVCFCDLRLRDLEFLDEFGMPNDWEQEAEVEPEEECSPDELDEEKRFHSVRCLLFARCLLVVLCISHAWLTVSSALTRVIAACFGG